MKFRINCLTATKGITFVLVVVLSMVLINNATAGPIIDNSKKESNKIKTVVICYANRMEVFGNMAMQVNGDGKIGKTKTGVVAVYIIREIAPKHANTAKKLGHKVGGAYYKYNDDTYKFIRNVDLKLSDKALAKQFGVSTSNN